MAVQKTNPNFSVPATRGYCLKYIDDAGNAPTRRPTAKAAFYAEQAAGRISKGDMPLNIWVVGFLDFTAGPYTKEGHVFFIKNLGGGRFEIRDSEVGAGARKPYGSLLELISWFSMYRPEFIGWSTDCDGRTYAEGDSMEAQDIRNIFGEVWGMAPDESTVQNLKGKSWHDNMYYMVSVWPWTNRKGAEAANGQKAKDLEAKVNELNAKVAELEARPVSDGDAAKQLKMVKDGLGIKE